jgi:AcrR family transcriptional regulator
MAVMPVRAEPKQVLIWARPERRLRIQHRSLSRKQIVRAALEVADGEGADAVSMRRVAAHLGAGTMSLYWYVSAKQDLLDLMVDAVLGEIEPLQQPPTDDWRADLKALAAGTRAVVLRHPWAAALVTVGRPLGPNALRHAEWTLSALDGIGLEPSTMRAVANTVNVYVLGSVRDELAERDADRQHAVTRAQWDDAVTPYLEQQLADGRYPTLARLVDEHTDSDQLFDFGLDCVLDGIAARIPRGGGGRRHFRSHRD